MIGKEPPAGMPGADEPEALANGAGRTEDSVASVTIGENSTTYSVGSQYATAAKALEAAFTAAQAAESATVTLLSDVDLGSGYLAVNAGDITFEGGAFTLSGSDGEGVISVSAGKFTLVSGTISGNNAIGLRVKGNSVIDIIGGKITAQNSSPTAVYISDDSQVIISGDACIESSGTGVALNGGGRVEITGGSITANSRGVCVYGGSALITGGEIKSTAGRGMWMQIYYISGQPSSVISSEAIIGGKAVISGFEEGVHMISGSLAVSGEARISGSEGVNINGSGEVSISEEAIVSGSNRGVVISFSNGNLTVSGGTVSAGTETGSGTDASGIEAKFGTVTITGGTVTGHSQNGVGCGMVVGEKSTARIEGGSFTGTDTGIKACGNTTISGGTVYGGNRGLDIAEGGKPATLTGGTFKGGNNSIYSGNPAVKMKDLLGESCAYYEGENAWKSSTS